MQVLWFRVLAFIALQNIFAYFAKLTFLDVLCNITTVAYKTLILPYRKTSAWELFLAKCLNAKKILLSFFDLIV